MIQRRFSVAIVCLLTFFVMAYDVHAQEKITGPWLWMIAPTEPGQGGAASIDIDSLAVASGGAVTEADVAQTAHVKAIGSGTSYGRSGKSLLAVVITSIHVLIGLA